MKKLMVSVLVIVVIVAVAIVFGRNILARTIIVSGIKNVCGVGVKIDSLDIGLPSVSITGLKIYNPSGFTDRLMADIPEIYVEFDLPAFFKNKVHLSKLKLDIKEMDVILNDKGKLNVNSLALLVPKSGGGKPPQVQIDELGIKIAKVNYKGYFPGVGAQSKEFNPNIDKTLHSVTEPSKVAAEIMRDILSKIGIYNFAQFDVKGEVQKAVQQVGTAAEEAVQKTKQGVENLFKK